MKFVRLNPSGRRLSENKWWLGLHEHFPTTTTELLYCREGVSEGWILKTEVTPIILLYTALIVK